MVEATGSPRIEIVAWVDADDSALCALVNVDGVVWGAVNTRMTGRAGAHIRQHVERGFTGTLVCTVGCPG